MKIKLTKHHFSHHKTIVCLPGFLGLASEFSFLIKPLSNQYNFILVDLPGSSVCPLEVNDQISFSELTKTLSQQLDESIKDQEVVLLGYSFGARLAVGVYQYLSNSQSKLKVNKLILESVNFGIALERERQARTKHDLLKANSINNQNFKQFLLDWYSNSIFTSLKSNATEQAERASHNHAVSSAIFLRDLTPGLMPNFWPLISKITEPVLLINGENDHIFREYAVKIKEQLACQSYLQLTAGHNVHNDFQEEYLEAVADFLA